MARKLEIKLEVDSKKGVANVKKVTRSVDDLNKKSSKAAKSMNKSFKGAKLATAALGVAIAGATAKLISMSKEMIDYGDKLNKINLRLGISVESLDKLRQVAGLAGVDFKTVTTAIRQMTIRIQEATKGSGLAYDEFKKLGISIDDIKKLSPEDQFKIIAKALGNMTNKSQQVNASFQIMGRGGVELISMYDGMEEQLKSVTAIMDKDFADAAAKFNDNLQKQGDSIKHYWNDFLKPWIKLMNEASDSNSKMNQSLLNTSTSEFGEPGTKKLKGQGTRGSNVSDYLSLQKTNEKLNAQKAIDKKIQDEKDKIVHVDETKKEKIRKETLIREAKLTDDLMDNWRLREERKFEIISQGYEQEILAEQEKNNKINELNEEQLKYDKELSDKLSNGIVDKMFAIADGTKSAKEAMTDYAKSFLKNMAKMILKQTILNSLQKDKGGGSSINYGSIISSALVGALSSAKGNAFQTFAQGGVVSQPTSFRLGSGAGLMGEAGAEAVLPLQRTSTGDLGVQTTGGGGGATNNITIQAMDSQSFDTFFRRNPGALVGLMGDLANKGNSAFKQSINKGRS